jgi:hypothetical protein
MKTTSVSKGSKAEACAPSTAMSAVRNIAASRSVFSGFGYQKSLDDPTTVAKEDLKKPLTN